MYQAVDTWEVPGSDILGLLSARGVDDDTCMLWCFHSSADPLSNACPLLHVDWSNACPSLLVFIIFLQCQRCTVFILDCFFCCCFDFCLMKFFRIRWSWIVAEPTLAGDSDDAAILGACGDGGVHFDLSLHRRRALWPRGE